MSDTILRPRLDDAQRFRLIQTVLGGRILLSGNYGQIPDTEAADNQAQTNAGVRAMPESW